MKVNLLTSADKNFDGICPTCKEWTTAGDSCCGDGAYVEGSLVTDEAATEDQDDPTVAIRVLVDENEERASAVSKALHEAGIAASMYSSNFQERKWNVSAFVPVSALSVRPDPTRLGNPISGKNDAFIRDILAAKKRNSKKEGE